MKRKRKKRKTKKMRKMMSVNKIEFKKKNNYFFFADFKFFPKNNFTVQNNFNFFYFVFKYFFLQALPFAAAPAAPVPRAPSSSSSRISKKPRRKSREGKRKHPPQNYSQELPSIMEPLPTLHEDLQDPANGGNVGLTQLMNDAAMLEDSAALPGNDALSFLEKIDQDSVAATDAGDNELAENISMPATDTEVEDNFTLSDLAPGVAFETTGGAWEEESDLWTE
eukprot:GHVT01102610.1.p1 GENE.GHVT01102610.1~~GHVT01102610.1.p1  ORF type:complete len:223 (+),score=49.25 GHVT01102610.1:1-669(+)